MDMDTNEGVTVVDSNMVSSDVTALTFSGGHTIDQGTLNMSGNINMS